MLDAEKVAQRGSHCWSHGEGVRRTSCFLSAGWDRCRMERGSARVSRADTSSKTKDLSALAVPAFKHKYLEPRVQATAPGCCYLRMGSPQTTISRGIGAEGCATPTSPTHTEAASPHSQQASKDTS
jgi:hypothetical protein